MVDLYDILDSANHFVWIIYFETKGESIDTTKSYSLQEGFDIAINNENHAKLTKRSNNTENF
jgi:hypothetical protein